MKLVDKLRARVQHEIDCGREVFAADLLAAISRIEAGDALDGEMPRDLTPLTVPDDDIRRAVAEYRALVREQDKE